MAKLIIFSIRCIDISQASFDDGEFLETFLGFILKPGDFVPAKVCI
jgi:hypothetical protein